MHHSPPADPAAAVDGPWIVGDIGGTNARFGWVDPASPGIIGHPWTTPVRAHAGPAQALAAYREQARLPRPGAVGLALATAITGDEVRLTNSPWHFQRHELVGSLGGARVVLLNDFEALALALPGLRADQVRGDGPLPSPTGVLAVVGPGTGLGVGAAVPTPTGWQALPGEGGHATLAAADDFESELLAWVRRRHEHVSAERLLSGLGLPLLHQAAASVRGRHVDAVETPALVAAGVAGEADAAATLDVFCALLGGFCGSVVLTFGARAGLYMGGGIVPRLGDAFFRSRFRDRFEAKGRFRGYLAAVPSAVVVDTEAALGGVAAAMRRR